MLHSCRARVDAITPTVRGTFDGRETYKHLDVVVSDGAAFIAKCNDPGLCPGVNWQMLARQGKPGRPGIAGERGPRGEKGDTGPPADVPRFVSSEIDSNYHLIILRSDGSREVIPLRPAFELYHKEVGSE